VSWTNQLNAQNAKENLSSVFTSSCLIFGDQKRMLIQDFIIVFSSMCFSGPEQLEFSNYQSPI